MAKRTHQIHFNLNDFEFKKFNDLCKDLGCTRPDFFRALIETPIITKRIDAELGTGFIVLYPNVVSDLAWQVQKVGTNINQATKGINTIAARQFLKERDMINELDNIHEMLSDIETSIEEIKKSSMALYQLAEEHRGVYINRKIKL